jgi:hypothetical protein
LIINTNDSENQKKEKEKSLKTKKESVLVFGDCTTNSHWCPKRARKR